MATIEWQGKTLTMGELTVKVKDDWCEWCCDFKIKHACSKLSAYPDALAIEVSKWDTNSVWWGDGTMSELAWKMLKGKHGSIKLHRLLFGDSAKHLSDSDLYRMIAAKEADPASDYVLAFKKAQETSDPKAGGPVSSAGPEAGMTITG